MSIANGQFFPPPNPWQMMTVLNPLDALIPKNPFSFFFGRIQGPGHLRGPGVSLGRILGRPSIEPFWGGWSRQRAVSPPEVESLPTPGPGCGGQALCFLLCLSAAVRPAYGHVSKDRFAPHLLRLAAHGRAHASVSVRPLPLPRPPQVPLRRAQRPHVLRQRLRGRRGDRGPDARGRAVPSPAVADPDDVRLRRRDGADRDAGGGHHRQRGALPHQRDRQLLAPVPPRERPGVRRPRRLRVGVWPGAVVWS